MGQRRDPSRTWNRPRKEGRFLGFTLLALGLLIFLLGLGSPGLYDPHESQYAEIAREMLVRGDWVTPHLNDIRYLDKPPLLYWLIGLSYLVFGVSEFSARLPVALAGLGGVLLTWSIGRQLFTEKAGFFGGLVLMTCLGYVIFARQLLPDLLFSFCTTLSFLFFLRSSRGDRFQHLYTILFSLSLALAVLTKGLFGLFPLVVIGLHVVLIGRVREVQGIGLLWGGLLFVILVAPWHLAIGWKNEGYVWQYLMNEHVLRFLGRRDPVDYISLPLPVFFLLLFLWLLPWSVHLALVAPTRWVRGIGKDLDPDAQGSLLLLLWAEAILLFFSVSQARLPQYSLPGVPALALLIGKSLDDRFTGKAPYTKGILIGSASSLLLPALAFLLLPAYIERYHQIGLPEQIVPLIRKLFALIVAGGGLAILAFSRRRWMFGLLSLVSSMVAVLFFVHQILVLLEPLQSSKAVAALIDGSRTPDEKIVLEVEKDEPFEYEKVSGLGFYTGQKVHLLRRNAPKFPLPLKPEERFLLSETEFHQLWRSGERVYLVTDSFLADGGVLDQRSVFAIMGKVGNRWVLSNKP